MVKGVSLGWTWYVAPAPAAAEAPPRAAAHVFGPTMPSAVKPCWVCQVFVAAAVFGPNCPSGVTPMIFCQSTTSAPLEPCRIVACVVTGVVAVGAIGIAGAATGIDVAIGGAIGIGIATDATATPCT